jgi:hypothetical protein
MKNFEMSSADAKLATPRVHLNDFSNIYIYDNDPKYVGRGMRVTSLKHYENGGGYFPFITDESYNDRKFSNIKYNYEDRKDFGIRPMHRSTVIEKDPRITDNYSTQSKNVRFLVLF